jgi:membrane protein
MVRLEPAQGLFGWWALFRDAALRWIDHKAGRLGAALAYYSVFSIGPLMLIAIAVAGLFFGAEAVRGQVSGQLVGLLGKEGAEAVETMLAGASQQREGIFATIVGILTLLLGATGVVVQLKDALNSVWRRRDKLGRAFGRLCEATSFSSRACLASVFCSLFRFY